MLGTDDELWSYLIVPESPTPEELELDNSLLPETEHLRGKATDQQLEAVKVV